MNQIFARGHQKKKVKLFLRIVWRPLGTQSVNMATFDFFPQNMATLVRFFPQKNSFSHFSRDFFVRHKTV